MTIFFIGLSLAVQDQRELLSAIGDYYVGVRSPPPRSRAYAQQDFAVDCRSNELQPLARLDSIQRTRPGESFRHQPTSGVALKGKIEPLLFLVFESTLYSPP